MSGRRRARRRSRAKGPSDRDARPPPRVAEHRHYDHGMRSRWSAALSAAAIAALLTGCQGAPSPDSPTPTGAATPASTCDELAVQVVDAVQAYVDSFADVDAAGVANAANARQARVRGDDGGPARPRRHPRLRTRRAGRPAPRRAGPPRRWHAGAGRDRGHLPGRSARHGGPLRPAARGITVSSGPELAAALRQVWAPGRRSPSPPGSTPSPPRSWRCVPSRSSGPARTRPRSRPPAPGAALIALTTGDLRLVDLALTHVGDEPASVALVASGGYAFERVRISGARSDADGVGGFGLIVRPDANPLTGGGTLQRLTDVEASDYAGGGIVVGGRPGTDDHPGERHRDLRLRDLLRGDRRRAREDSTGSPASRWACGWTTTHPRTSRGSPSPRAQAGIAVTGAGNPDGARRDLEGTRPAPRSRGPAGRSSPTPGSRAASTSGSASRAVRGRTALRHHGDGRHHGGARRRRGRRAADHRRRDRDDG